MPLASKSAGMTTTTSWSEVSVEDFLIDHLQIDVIQLDQVG
jgi:hypothetical protein